MRAIFKKQAVPVKPSLWCFVDLVNIPEHSFSPDHGTLYKDLGTEPRAPRSPAQPHSQSCVFHPAPSRPPQDAHTNGGPSKNGILALAVWLAWQERLWNAQGFLSDTVVDSKGRKTPPQKTLSVPPSCPLSLLYSSLYLSLPRHPPAPLWPTPFSPTQTSLTTSMSL